MSRGQGRNKGRNQKRNRGRGRRNNRSNEVSVVVGMVSLGCAKNTADTERILGMLASSGFVVTGDTDEADIVLINTCAFIEAAREETMEVIRSFEGHKPVIALGCYSERSQKEPEVIDTEFGPDVTLLGFEEYDNIPKVIAKKLGLKIEGEGICYNESPRLLTGTPVTAYLKIAEGCSNCCTYCAVPNIRGPLVSMDKDALLDEAMGLVELGVKEICVIAQDVASFGRDTTGEPKLVEFVSELAQITELEWIRLMYVHPTHLTREIAELIAREKKVLPYIDLPIQHASDKMLKAMNRHHTKKELVERIAMLRELNSDITIRTSVIVGFPGETEDDFNELMEFIEETRFEHLGAFTYSHEPGTVAYDFENQVPPEVASERANKIMELQQKIAFEILDSRIGESENVILEYEIEPGTWEARSRHEAPDVDGRILIKGVPEELDEVHIVHYFSENRVDYDLHGKHISKKEY